MRRRPDAPNGLTEFLIVETVEWAKAEGASELSLNFCAFTDVISPERATTIPKRVARRVLLAADNVFQLERLLLVQPEVPPGVAAAATSASSGSRTSRRRPRVPPRRVAARAARPVDAAPRAPRHTRCPMARSRATRSIGRLSEIAQVMVRHGFGYFFEAHKLTDLLPGRSAEARLARAAERARARRAASTCARCSTSSGRRS